MDKMALELADQQRRDADEGRAAADEARAELAAWRARQEQS